MASKTRLEFAWLGPSVRWIQFGFLITTTMLVGRASRMILNHEYESAKLNQQHETNWASTLDEARARHDVSLYGDDVWFVMIILIWILVAAVLTVQFFNSKYPATVTFDHHKLVVKIALALILIMGVYLFVMSIIIHEDFKRIECPIDHSARSVIDASSSNVYVTCMKQDYTEDLFNAVFGPLFILLTFELLLVATTHWTVEVVEINRKAQGYSLLNNIESHLDAKPSNATMTSSRLFF